MFDLQGKRCLLDGRSNFLVGRQPYQIIQGCRCGAESVPVWSVDMRGREEGKCRITIFMNLLPCQCWHKKINSTDISFHGRLKLAIFQAHMHKMIKVFPWRCTVRGGRVKGCCLQSSSPLCCFSTLLAITFFLSYHPPFIAFFLYFFFF